MSRFFVIVLFSATWLLDGIIMPELFHRPDTFLIWIFLATFLVAYGSQSWVIGYGLLFAFICDVSLGSYIGVFAGAWLIAVWLWYGLTQVFSLRPFREEPLSTITSH